MAPATSFFESPFSTHSSLKPFAVSPCTPPGYPLSCALHYSKWETMKASFMRMASVCILMFCQVLTLFVLFTMSPIINHHLADMCIALPLPTIIALGLSTGYGRCVPILILAVSAFIAILLIRGRRKSDDMYREMVLLLTAITVLQLVIAGCCLMFILLPFYC